VVGEIEYWKSLLLGVVRPSVRIIPYAPERRQLPPRVLEVPSAWKGIESILAELIARFDVSTGTCLEFGVERGYSTAAFSCFFDKVTGVDTFLGDIHTRDTRDLYAATVNSLSKFDNIQLIRSDYRDWIAKDDGVYDLIHIDIVHTYADTLACGLWGAEHAHCVLFHDTESFPAVKRAVIDVSRMSGKKFYNLQEFNGLGILV
jgi:hypothetical protein